MNLYKEWPGIQEDITWSDINYTPFANRAFIHKLGKALSGNSDFILEGCAFSKIAGTSATVTAGYVFDQTSGEVVQVDAQTVAETLGTNNWTLVKTTTYDPAGNNTYRTGGPNDNYQQERMVLTNVVSVGSGFDVENVNAKDVWTEIAQSEINLETEWSHSASASNIRYKRDGKTVHLVCTLLVQTSGSWVANDNWEIQILKSEHWDVNPVDGTSGVTRSVAWEENITDSTQNAVRISISNSNATYIRIIFAKEDNFLASKSYRFTFSMTFEVI